jgi:hypothetical protein
MPSIMADHDVEGHLKVLLNVWSSPKWADLWQDASWAVESFSRLGIASTASDEEVWTICQQRGIVLITGNRNAEGDDSLELTIRRRGTPQSLPVLTIANPNRLFARSTLCGGRRRAIIGLRARYRKYARRWAALLALKRLAALGPPQLCYRLVTNRHIA